MKIEYDSTQVDNLVQKGSAIAMDAAAEEAILTLLEIEAKVQQARDELLKLIDERATELENDWKVIKSDHVKINKSPTGAKYVVDMEKVAKEFISVTETTRPNTEKIEEYIETTDNLPVGVSFRERNFAIKLKEV